MGHRKFEDVRLGAAIALI